MYCTVMDCDLWWIKFPCHRYTRIHVYRNIVWSKNYYFLCSLIHLKFDINNNNSHAHKKFLKVLHMVMFCHLWWIKFLCHRCNTHLVFWVFFSPFPLWWIKFSCHRFFGVFFTFPLWWIKFLCHRCNTHLFFFCVFFTFPFVMN